MNYSLSFILFLLLFLFAYVKNFLYVCKKYYASSKTCECGVKNKDLKLSDREWVCSSCGVINKRDLLASQNILKEGRRSLGDTKTNVETEVTRSMKR